MTDNDIRAGVVARTQHSVRRDDAQSWIRACLTARLRAGRFNRAPSTTATPGLTDQLTDVSSPAGV
ncbi:hypothetical protein [Mycobacterium sp.]|jgi:hypothetical protein|uniref:hypothetical protein n=1 Tax=Mycobacterium sp. TaxID=1785 RepID=UPI00333FF195